MSEYENLRNLAETWEEGSDWLPQEVVSLLARALLAALDLIKADAEQADYGLQLYVDAEDRLAALNEEAESE